MFSNFFNRTFLKVLLAFLVALSIALNMDDVTKILCNTGEILQITVDACEVE